MTARTTNPKVKFSSAVLTCFLLLAAASAMAQTEAQKSFAQIKNLDGSWAGKSSDGMPVQVSFRATAGDSAILSEIQGHHPQAMVTMFYLDGPDKLLLTHYCSAGNQPRMLASASPDGKTLTFDFVDATNLASPEAGHMRRVVFAMLDADHHTEQWVFSDHGKEKMEVFDLHRN